jgi:hypothetical protein
MVQSVTVRKIVMNQAQILARHVLPNVLLVAFQYNVRLLHLHQHFERSVIYSTMIDDADKAAVRD